jgi:hypothetical protein
MSLEINFRNPSFNPFKRVKIPIPSRFQSVLTDFSLGPELEFRTAKDLQVPHDSRFSSR